MSEHSLPWHWASAFLLVGGRQFGLLVSTPFCRFLLPTSRSPSSIGKEKPHRHLPRLAWCFLSHCRPITLYCWGTVSLYINPQLCLDKNKVCLAIFYWLEGCPNTSYAQGGGISQRNGSQEAGITEAILPWAPTPLMDRDLPESILSHRQPLRNLRKQERCVKAKGNQHSGYKRKMFFENHML